MLTQTSNNVLVFLEMNTNDKAFKAFLNTVEIVMLEWRLWSDGMSDDNRINYIKSVYKEKHQ